MQSLSQRQCTLDNSDPGISDPPVPQMADWGIAPFIHLTPSPDRATIHHRHMSPSLELGEAEDSGPFPAATRADCSRYQRMATPFNFEEMGYSNPTLLAADARSPNQPRDQRMPTPFDFDDLGPATTPAETNVHRQPMPTSFRFGSLDPLDHEIVESASDNQQRSRRTPTPFDFAILRPMIVPNTDVNHGRMPTPFDFREVGSSGPSTAQQETNLQPDSERLSSFQQEYHHSQTLAFQAGCTTLRPPLYSKEFVDTHTYIVHAIAEIGNDPDELTFKHLEECLLHPDRHPDLYRHKVSLLYL